MKFGYRGVAGRCRACAAFRILMGLALPWDWASADESPRAPFLESLAVYVGQGVDHNLLDLPRSILGGDIAWEASYFAGIGLSGTFGTFGEDIPILGDNPLGKIRHGCEVVVAKHHGLQDNLEAGAVYLLRTPDAHLGWLRVNVAAGVGLSYAFDEPTYEDVATDDPEEYYRLLLLALFEFEW